MIRTLVVAAVLLYHAPTLAECQQRVLDHDEKRLLGGSENLCQTYGGKVVLVVNTASHCGYTPQYEGLEQLYRRYKDRGFVVLGFPSNDFLQEWDGDDKVQKFCKANYGVSFPMFGKVAVRGSDANPLFLSLKQASGAAPSWNFNKYLIGRDGKVVRYASTVTPDSPDLLKAIDKAIDQPADKTIGKASGAVPTPGA